MKIGMLAQSGAVHTKRWCQGLSQRGDDILLISNSAFPGQPTGERIKTIVLPGSSSLSYFYNLPRVRRLLNDFKPDIVHTHYATGYGLWGAMQKVAPLVVTAWGTDITDAASGKFIISNIVRHALKKAVAVTAPSRYLLDAAIKFEPEVNSKGHHIPFGLEFNEDIQPGEKKSDDNVQFIFSKQFYPIYAPKLVLDAFAQAHRVVSDISLVMIGGGPLKDEMVRLTDDLKITSSVTIRDWTKMDQAQEIIAQSDIMVMPSHHESFGVAALEAASFGLPVIATRVGGIPEVVEHNQTGLLIPPGDVEALTTAMITLAKNKSIRVKMGQAGREMVRSKYNFSDNIDQMRQLYQDILRR